MSASYKLSIIIPVYNEAPRLERCLGSVALAMRGHERDVQVIVIDDGSTDGSAELCDGFDDIFEVYHDQNRGVSLARNAGIYHANGKYITFIDSDDEMSKYGIKAMLEIIEEHSDWGIIQLNHKRHYGKIHKTVLKYTNPTKRFGLDELPLCWPMVWNKLYRADVLNGVRFWPKMQYGEDELFNLKCIKKQRYIFCIERDAIIKHFDNPDSLCHQLDKYRFRLLTGLLHQWMDGLDDPEFERLLARRLAELWNSKIAENLWS